MAPRSDSHVPEDGAKDQSETDVEPGSETETVIESETDRQLDRAIEVLQRGHRVARVSHALA